MYRKWKALVLICVLVTSVISIFTGAVSVFASSFSYPLGPGWRVYLGGTSNPVVSSSSAASSFGTVSINSVSYSNVLYYTISSSKYYSVEFGLPASAQSTQGYFDDGNRYVVTYTVFSDGSYDSSCSAFPYIQFSGGSSSLSQFASYFDLRPGVQRYSFYFDYTNVNLLGDSFQVRMRFSTLRSGSVSTGALGVAFPVGSVFGVIGVTIEKDNDPAQSVVDGMKDFDDYLNNKLDTDSNKDELDGLISDSNATEDELDSIVDSGLPDGFFSMSSISNLSSSIGLAGGFLQHIFDNDPFSYLIIPIAVVLGAIGILLGLKSNNSS